MATHLDTPSNPVSRSSVPVVRHIAPLALGGVVVLGLAIVGRANFLFFHSLAEFISIAAGWGVFILAWNARQRVQNDLLLLLSIALFFVGILDLVHVLAYEGMNVFPGYGADLSAQLWIAARYLQSLSALVAVALGVRADSSRLRRGRGRPEITVASYAVVAAIAIWLIFARIFPPCYVEGGGLTAFKSISEYLIMLFLVLTGALLWHSGARLGREVRILLLISVAATFVAELALAPHNDVYNIPNLIGHLFKVIAVSLLYQAVVHTGISQPYIDLSQELQASEARLQSIFQVAPTGIGLVKNRIIQEVNPLVCQMTGYAESELVGASARLLYPTQADFDYVGEEKYRQIGVSGTGVVQTRWQRKDGKIIDVLLASTPLAPANLDQGVIFTALDVTQREQLAATVREQAQRLQGILDTVPEGVLLLGTDGRILLTDSVADRDMATLGELLPDGRLAGLGNRPLAELLAAPPEGLWHEFRAGTRTYEATSHPVEDGLQPEHYVLVYRDVTLRRQAAAERRQQERLAAVGQLAAGIAHDFNNILAVIILYAQLSLQTPDVPDRLRAHSEVIVDEAKRGSNLVQQILDFGRRAILERRPIDLAMLMEAHIALLRRTLPESIRVDLQTPADGMGILVNADTNRLKQLVTNLAINARDAMPDGGVLTISVAPVTISPDASSPPPGIPAGSWAKLAVADTGTGMSPDVRAHLFEPFFTTKAPGKGSGLGLAQVYGIVKQHEGYIITETEEGHGATFSVYLPMLEAGAQTSATVAQQPLVRGRGETILVVEDNPALRLAIVDTLEQLGYQIVEATNGREALRLLEQHPGTIAAVLSDLVMPVMGGQALLNALEQQDIHLPFLMMTGHPLDHEMQGMQYRGLVTWLRKPLQLEQLTNVLRQALASRRR